MANFFYRARDGRGLLVVGNREASGLHDIEHYLTEHGMIPIRVRETRSGPDFSFLKKIFEKQVKPEEILVLTRQFHTLFKAGMSMEVVLSTLERQASHKRLQEVLSRIRSDISAGESLSTSFSRYADIFGDLYINMLAAGEEAGILEEVLENLYKVLEKELQIKSSVKSATLYPKIVVFVLTVAIVVIMSVVVPKFASFFAHYKAELPLPTRMLMGFSGFVSHGWPFLLLGAGGSWFAWRRYVRTARGKFRVGQLRFHLPVFGLLHLKVANARFCHILSALYRSGLSMTRALEITGQTIENGAFAREVEVLKGEIGHGKQVSEAMAGCRYFTPVIVEATAIGEKTGALDEMLESMGEHYDLEVQYTIKNLTTLLEPFLLVMIFGMVTIFALAIFLPIWNMSRAVTGH